MRLVVAVGCLFALTLPTAASAVGITQPVGNGRCYRTETVGTCTKARGLLGSDAIVVSPDNKNVYVASGPDSFGALAAFRRNRATGALTQLAGTAGCTSNDGRSDHELPSSKTCAKGGVGLGGLSDVAISADGKTVYAVSTFPAVDTFRRNTTTGALTLLQCFTAAAEDGCTAAAIQQPNSVTPSADGTTLFVGGEELSTFTLNPDGTIAGTGTCVAVLGTDPYDGCASAPRAAGLVRIGSLTAAPDGSRLYATAYFAGRLQQIPLTANVPQVDAATCFGTHTGCTPTAGAVNVHDIAVAADGSGVYTAASHFRQTNEESGGGYYASSAIGAFTGPDLAPLAGAQACALFGPPNVKPRPCGATPAARGKGFAGANAVALTPDGRTLVGVFDKAVALLKRDPVTQSLTPVPGKQGCLASSNKRVKPTPATGCGVGVQIGISQAVAIARDGRSAYTAGYDGVTVLRLR
jgi:sugar lactone lactonase YvrE